MSLTGKSPRGQLPATIEPILLAEKGAHLVGTLPIKGMARLMPSCFDDRGEVYVDLHFGRAESGNVYELTGRLEARLRVACQRCLGPMDLALATDVRLLLVRPGESAAGLAPEVEALAVDRPLHLSEFVEDELLLVMPMITMHPLDRCPARGAVKPAAPAVKPLAGLDRLKRR